MVRNSAVVVGINEYSNLMTLRYAKRDAELVSQFLRDRARTDLLYLFSDDSSPIPQDYGPDMNSYPTYANIRRFLRARFEKPFLGDGDNLWFFFAGHGIRHEGQDYLMPCDADPRDIASTAIPLSYVTERLRRSGADNVVMLIDACRYEGSRNATRFTSETLPGLIIFFSCSPNETSYEIGELQQGSFAYALIEGLHIGNISTVEKLDQYLKVRIPELNKQYGRPDQHPYVTVEPLSKAHLILIPESATLEDVQTLKVDAFKAETNHQFDIAKQLWIRVLSVSPADPEAIQSIERLAKIGTNNQSEAQVIERDESKPDETKLGLTERGWCC